MNNLIKRWAEDLNRHFSEEDIQISAEYGEKGILLHCSWECKLMQSLWRTVWKLPQKLKMNYHKNQKFHS